MDVSFGNRNALENGDGFLFYPVGKGAGGDELFNLGEGAAMTVFVLVVRAVLVSVRVLVFGTSVVMSVGVSVVLRLMPVIVVVVVVMILGEVYVEFDTFDGRLVAARDVQVVTFEGELSQFVFEPVRIDAESDEGAEEHVAAQAAVDIQVESVHVVPAASALIWLAA
jgi:hypothetical protein